MPEEKLNSVLIPYFGEELPKQAEEEALERLGKGGKIFLLHIVDDAPTRSLRYQTGQIGENSETIKSFRETMEKMQEREAEDYVEKVKDRAAKKGISVKPIYARGSPGTEVVKAVRQNPIQLVLIEQLRDRITEIFLGDELDYICREAACEVQTISSDED